MFESFIPHNWWSERRKQQRRPYHPRNIKQRGRDKREEKTKTTQQSSGSLTRDAGEAARHVTQVKYSEGGSPAGKPR